MADADNTNTNQDQIEHDEPAAKDGWEAYAKSMRAENKQRREHAKALEEKLKAAEAAAEAIKKEASEQLSKQQQLANERYLRAELKAEAVKAGMIDLDGLKLADLSKVTLSEDGTVQGAEELMKALKESKPYLFTQPKSSSTQPGAAPKAEDGKPTSVKDMTPEQYAKHKADALRKARGF